MRLGTQSFSSVLFRRSEHVSELPDLKYKKVYSEDLLRAGEYLVIIIPGSEVIKLFSSSTQLSMKFVLLINLKWLTILNSFLLNIVEHENFSANKFENANFFKPVIPSVYWTTSKERNYFRNVKEIKEFNLNLTTNLQIHE